MGVAGGEGDTQRRRVEVVVGVCLTARLRENSSLGDVATLPSKIFLEKGFICAVYLVYCLPPSYNCYCPVAPPLPHPAYLYFSAYGICVLDSA